ncbi:MAG: hybrid sensor histidine kinase/response regulator [Bacteroidales bacterium]|nr:hybrid sensor histidine kinase/response regulator [Bacteroidales bacterium]
MKTINEPNKFQHKILIVDDKAENIFALEQILYAENRSFLRANNGNDALKIAHAHPDISLILLDVQMPEMDGFEVAEFLGGNRHTSSIPIIFVTAISKERKYMIRGLEEGAIDYLFKPLDTDIVRAKVSTLLRIAEQQMVIKENNVALQELNEEKNYLIGMAAHDLRNPLAGILMLSDLLIQEDSNVVNDSVREMVKLMHTASKGMLDIINDLLDVSKISAGKLEINSRPIRISEIIQKSISNNKFQAEYKKIQIDFSTEGEVFKVMADSVRVEQIMDNLISNAVKYSENNTSIIINCHRSESGILVTVKDQGQGIPASELTKLFQPFSKAKGVRTTAGEASTGLGLAIVKKMVEAHNGFIWATSEEGVGSEFSFTLPEAVTPNA